MDVFARQGPIPQARRAQRASIAGEAIHEESEMQMAFPGYERSSSAEARGLEARAPLLGVHQQAWDRFNSADGVDPCAAKQLASAVEDKLKLAPILAKRLERVSHSSGSFSSRVGLCTFLHESAQHVLKILGCVHRSKVGLRTTLATRAGCLGGALRSAWLPLHRISARFGLAKCEHSGRA